MRGTILVIILLLASFANSQECGPHGYNCIYVGDPVLVRFSYEGGLNGWDGWIVAGEKEGQNSLSVANNMFLVVSRGLQEFEKPSKRKLKLWETFEAPRGVLVSPVKGRVSFPA